MRKRKPVKRPRRSPYERSLDYATKRLEKATAEQKDCQARLMALNQEIPYLQTVIRALTPPEPFKETIDMRDISRKVAPSIFRPAPVMSPLTSNTLSANVDELPSEEDAFLNVTIPGEKEMLP